MQSFFSYRLTTDLSDIGAALNERRQIVVNCLNPHSFVEALYDDNFRKALESSDALLPDGEGICLALKRWKKININKIAGDDLHSYLLDYLGKNGGKVFYMGSSKEVVEKIKKRLKQEYPTVDVAVLSPSYSEKMSESETVEVVNAIEEFKPDVLFVSMTAPKQEKWVMENRYRLKNPVVIASVGAVFDFYAGTVKRAPAWAVKMKLEWLVRFLKEPKRMWKRNFVSTPKFLRWMRKHHSEL